MSQGGHPRDPRERYLQLIDDLNNGDADKRKKAQDFLKSLAGIDVSVQYDATVWFDNLHQDDQLEAAVFRATTPTFDEISVRLASGNNINRITVHASPVSAQFLAHAKDDLTNKFYSILSDAFGTSSLINIGTPGHLYLIGFAGPKTVTNLGWTLENSGGNFLQRAANTQSSVQAPADQARKQMATALADAVFNPYSQIVPPNTGPFVSEKNWSLIDGTDLSQNRSIVVSSFTVLRFGVRLERLMSRLLNQTKNA